MHKQGPETTEARSHNFQFPHHIDKDAWGPGADIRSLESFRKSGAEKILESEALVPWSRHFFLSSLLFCYGLWFCMSWPHPPSDALFWSSPPPTLVHSALPHYRHLTVLETQQAGSLLRAFALPIGLPGMLVSLQTAGTTPSLRLGVRPHALREAFPDQFI